MISEELKRANLIKNKRAKKVKNVFHVILVIFFHFIFLGEIFSFTGNIYNIVMRILGEERKRARERRLDKLKYHRRND